VETQPPTQPGRAVLDPVATHAPRRPAPLPHSCRCGTRWAGTRTAHCGACHHTFTGIGPFDRHRRDGTCLNPADVGLVPIPGRQYRAWGTTTDTTEETP
jgi:hypothetical protein